MTMITPSYLGETIEYSSLHACRSTLEDPTIAETGFIAEESYRPLLTGKIVEGSEAAQAAYVRLLLRSASRQQARFVVWFFPQDVDEFWEQQTNPVAKWFVKIWRDSGLVDGSGREREGLMEWDHWLQQPRTSVRR